MEDFFVLAIVLSLIFAVLFFIEEYYDDENKFQIHPSLIAGISISYFFLILLPEIAQGLPVFTIGNIEYIFILLGFCFIHVSEKLIIQKVEFNSQRRVRKMIKKEKILEAVEHSIEGIINNEIQQEPLDELALKDMVRTLNDLHVQSNEIMASIKRTKLKIEKHIDKELNELRFITDFAYHFLVGFIIYNLLLLEPLTGLLFFIFAFFRAIIGNRSEKVEIPFSDLDIKIKIEESKKRQLIFALSVVIGVLFSVFFDLIIPVHNTIYLEVIYVVYSFVSGVILYVIVREVIPKNEKGNVIYFILGVVASTILFVIIKYIQALL
jgi:zinc transporter ZupT